MRIRDEEGWNPSVYNIRYIKPLDTELLEEASASHSKFVTVEDGSVLGGLHAAVAEFLSAGRDPKVVRAVGIPDEYISQGTQEELRHECGLTADTLYSLFYEEYEKNFKKD